MIGRVVRRALRRVIRVLIRGRVVVLPLLGLLLIAGLVSTFQSSGTGSSGTGAGSLPGVNFSLPGPRKAPDSTESYLKGNQNYNAELIWSSYSDEALERLRARGRSIQDDQRQMEMARERGIKLEQINYVGGHGLPDGTSLQFYVVSARAPSRPEPEYVTYIFTLDRSGKITKVQ